MSSALLAFVLFAAVIALMAVGVFVVVVVVKSARGRPSSSTSQMQVLSGGAQDWSTSQPD